MFVQTYDIVYMQTALIQIKDFHSHSLKKINLQEYREFKIKALIKAILAAEQELSQLFRKSQSLDNKDPAPVANIHGNIKASNIFIENAGQNASYEPVIIFSDQASLSQPTNDSFAIANVIHELISGMRINLHQNGKWIYHYRVKNSPYFRHIE